MKDDKIKFAEGVELIESLDVSDSAKDLFYERVLNEGIGDVISGATKAVGSAKEGIIAKFAKMAQKQAAKKAGDVTKITETVTQNLQGMLRVIELNATVSEEQKKQDTALINKYLTEITTLTKDVVAKHNAAEALKAKMSVEHPEITEKEKEAEAAGQSMTDALDKVDSVNDTTTMGVAIEALNKCAQTASGDDDQALADSVETLQAKVEDISAKDVEAVKKQIEALNGCVAQSAADAPKFAEACKELANALQEKLNAPEEPVDETEEPVDPESESSAVSDTVADQQDAQADEIEKLNAEKEDLQKKIEEKEASIDPNGPDEANEHDQAVIDELKKKMEEIDSKIDALQESCTPESISEIRNSLKQIRESLERINVSKHLR